MVQVYADIRDLTAATLRADLGALPDVIVGSPPCQDISTANSKGNGVDGARSGLFFEALRIVEEIRPIWLALENVSSLRVRGYDRIAARLEGAGYAVQPFVAGADDIGAPHRRKRVWIVAADADQGGLLGQPERDGWAQGGLEAPQRHDAGGLVADAADAERVELREQPGRGGGANGSGAAQPGEHVPARDAPDAEQRGRWKEHPFCRYFSCCGASNECDDPNRCWLALHPDAAPDDPDGGRWEHFYDGREWIGLADAPDAERIGHERAKPAGPPPALRRRPPDQDQTRWPAADAADAGPERQGGRRVRSGLPNPQAAVGGPWPGPWASGLPAAALMDDGLAELVAERRGLYRAICAAQGDAVVPQIPLAIGRAMRRIYPGCRTVLDLFSGAAVGWSLGMTWAGYDVVALCEIDDWRRRVALAAHEHMHQEALAP